MKKVFLTLIVLFSIFQALSFPVYSQIPTGIPIPGQNCGNPIASDAQGKKCCYYKPERITIRTGIPVIDPALDALSGFIDEHVLGKVLNPLDELITKTVQPCLEGQPSTPGNIADPSCTCVTPSISPLDTIKPLCANIDRSKGDGEYNECLNCLSGSNGRVGIWTGIGCVYTDTKSFIQETVFRLGIGLAGGLALLCIIYAAFMMQSSQGNPEKLKKAQEMLTSCVMGLMLIIFSVFILRLIGVNILKIPGFQ